MKLLINASNLKMGGSLQVAHSFIHEIKQNKEIQFHVVLSRALSDQIDQEDFPGNFTFYDYSMNVKDYHCFFGKNCYLERLEKMVRPDCVFTIFGPTYWAPKARHVVGFADGWCYYPDSMAYKNIPGFSRFKRHLMVRYKILRIKHEFDTLIVETQDAKKRVATHLHVDQKKIHVVGNTFHDVYNQEKTEKFEIRPHLPGEFRLLTISANYLHKNLRIIQPVVKILIQKGLKVRFYLTIDHREFVQMFGNDPEGISNLGPVRVVHGPSLYKQVDALFLPTLLETFTSSYPEAMKMGKPILTSDLSFARDICGETAIYFNPLDPEDIAEKIVKLVQNPAIGDALVEQGYRRLLTFETSASRAAKYLSICQENQN